MSKFIELRVLDGKGGKRTLFNVDTIVSVKDWISDVVPDSTAIKVLNDNNTYLVEESYNLVKEMLSQFNSLVITSYHLELKERADHVLSTHAVYEGGRGSTESVIKALEGLVDCLIENYCIGKVDQILKLNAVVGKDVTNYILSVIDDFTPIEGGK